MQRLGAARGERIQKLDQRLLSLRPDRIIDVRRVQRRIRADGRKCAAPDDGQGGDLLADGLRHGDGGLQLRPAHDGDAHGGDGRVADGAQRGRDEVAIDVAVDDRRLVLAVEGIGKAHDRQGKARMALRGDGRVDEQNTLRIGHHVL